MLGLTNSYDSDAEGDYSGCSVGVGGGGGGGSSNCGICIGDCGDNGVGGVFSSGGGDGGGGGGNCGNCGNCIGDCGDSGGGCDCDVFLAMVVGVVVMVQCV